MDELEAVARAANATMSYGAGGETRAGATLSVETGVVYGGSGEFGCYASVCAGIAPDAGFNAYMNLGTYSSYASFEGQSVATNQGVSTPFVRIGPGFSTSQVMSSSGRLIGANNAVSFGIGISPIPFEVGVMTCCTAVIDGGTGRLRDLASGVNRCSSQLEGLGSALAGNGGGGTPASTSTSTTQASAPSAPGASVAVGGTVQGRVSASTPRFNGKPMVFHDFQCRARQQIQVDATSSWDNVISIVDSGRRQVAYNDDTNGRNARVTYTCPDGGRYRIGVGAYSAANTGPYTLQVAAVGGRQGQRVEPVRPTAQITNGTAVNRYRQNERLALERVTGTEYVRVQVSGRYLHTERGRLERGRIQPGWHSAMWELERVRGTNYYRLKNRYRGTYLHTENGAVEAGVIRPDWWSAMWTVSAPR